MPDHDPLIPIDEQQFIQDFTTYIVSGPPLKLELFGDIAFSLMSTLQLAFRHSDYPTSMRTQIAPFYETLKSFIARTPTLDAVVQAGEDPRYDTPITGKEQPRPAREVHNVWTIYGMNPDGTEASEKLAMLHRPQDWGDRQRWHYEQMTFEWQRKDGRYINHFHGWTDLNCDDYQYPELFASLIVQIYMPGRPAELCGRDFVAEEDMWDQNWGPMPPVYLSDDELSDFDI